MISLTNYLKYKLSANDSIAESCEPTETIITDFKENNDIIKNELLGKFIPDVYLPQGCKKLGLKEKTFIEFKTTLRNDTLYNIERKLSGLNEETSLNYNFVIIYYTAVDGLDEIIKYYQSEKNLDIRKFDEFINPQVKNKNTVCLTAFSKRIDQQGTKSLAYKKFAEGPNTIFLGSGVSSSAGLPTWEGLLKELLKKEDNTFYDNATYDALFKKSGYSSIIAARYINEFYGNNKDKLANAIHDIFYKDNKEKESNTVNSICNLVSHVKGKVSGIITYNYDDIIERKLEKLNEPYHTVCNNNDPKMGLPICHVHGLLPKNKKGELPQIVLSEDEYHDLYKNSYNWSNIEQMHALQRTNCFFIGLSMSDPNLRRLLEISQGEDTNKHSLRHFVFLRREKDIDGITNIEEFFKHEENVMLQLGVGIIWYKDYNELYKEIDALANVNDLLSI